MRIVKAIAVVLALSITGMLLMSCGSGEDTTAVTEDQLVTVQRGDLRIDVISSGNLVFSLKEGLTFGSAGTVGEVQVEVGDSVEEGQVLASLDSTSVTSLQKAVLQAEINYDNAVEQAETPYTALDIAQAEAAVANAAVALEAAEEALEKAEDPYTESDIAQAEIAVLNAEIALDNAQKQFDAAEERYINNPTVPQWIRDYEKRKNELVIAEAALVEAGEALAEMKAGADPLEVAQKQKQLAVAQAGLKEAEDNLAEMLDGDDSPGAELRQLAVIDAWTALNEAEERLEMATMVAPFAALVLAVNVEAGQAVSANQVVIELADPDKFEADILVSEMDILQLQVGAPATIEVEAMSGISLPATVTSIAPTATIQQGVVNYRVTVELRSLDLPALASEPEISSDEEVQPPISPENIDELLDRAVKEGRISQQQADRMKAMMENITEEQLEQFRERLGQGFVFGQRPGGILSGGIMRDSVQLRQGQTVTVSVIIQQRNDVLLVPNQAIMGQGMSAYVRVMKDGEIEERPVRIGLSDWQYTEIIEGLGEGEQVVVPETTGTSTTPTLPQQQQGGPFRIFR